MSEASEETSSYPSSSAGKPDTTEYYLREYEQVLERLDAFERMRLQIATFAGTANLTAFGFALTQAKGIVFIVPVGIIAFYLVVEVLARRQHQIYHYRGLQLQRMLSDDDPETFLKLHPGAQARKAREILALETPAARKLALRQSKTHFSGIFFWFPVLVFFGEVLFAFVSVYVTGWPWY